MTLQAAADVAAIEAAQQRWARDLSIGFDKDGYCIDPDQNFFHPVSPESRAEFDAADGSEFGKEAVRGKTRALHSSAALACNFFDYWRRQDLSVFTEAFGLAATPLSLAFERKFPTGIGGIAPNVDVVFSLPGGYAFAIESKFSEPYSASKSKFHLKPKYFPDASGLWAAAGLTGCQGVADQLRAGAHSYKVLDVAQLLKHMLGLACRGEAWHLCCHWYRVDGLAGDQHQLDLESFSQQLGRDAG